MRFPLQSHRITLAMVACLSTSLIGCRDKNIITQADCVGTYEYHFQGNAEGTACFTLRGDGTYILGKSQGKQQGLAFFRLSPTGSWHINNDYVRQQLFIDKVTIPLKRTNGRLSAQMNTDYDISCDLLPGSRPPA